jgi:carbon monoxide dehydrogenase subunit G
MVEVTRTFTVRQPSNAVLAYLQDFAHTEEWDPGTVACVRLDAGPVLSGSRWKNVSKFLGHETELSYTLTRLDDDRLTFTGENDTVTAIDDIRAVPGDTTDSSVITYHAMLDLHGAARRVAPVTKMAFEKLADDTVERMTTVLSRLPEVVSVTHTNPLQT